MRVHTVDSRPHVQGHSAALRLRHSAGDLTDAAGLLLLRRLWDRLGLGQRIDAEASWLRGAYRPSLMVELWTVLLLYGGGRMDDLRLLEGRGVRRLFGWHDIPDPTTFGRWLRRGGERLATQLDGVLWQMVRGRWTATAVPRSVMLVLDSTVVQRYGLKQAGAEGVQPQEARSTQPSSVGGLPGRDRRLLGRAVASREREHRRRGDPLDPDARRAAPRRGSAGDHGAARQGVLLSGDGPRPGGSRRLLRAQGARP